VEYLYENYTYTMTAKKAGYDDTNFGFTVGTEDITVNVNLQSGGSQGITVLTPSGGNYPIGTTLTITYSYDIPGDNVKIELSRDNGSTWTDLWWSTPATGSIDWQVTHPAAAIAKSEYQRGPSRYLR